MKNSPLYYSVGALLYCPANNETFANSIINEKFGTCFSLALCLEDTIADAYVLEAEEMLYQSIRTIYEQTSIRKFFLPKLFIRVRNPEQMLRIQKRLSHAMSIITGFIVPKFSLETADTYIQTIIQVNERSSRPIYMMPIYESPSLIPLRSRYDLLYSLKDKLSQIEELVLNIRVGGNDLCHVFGFRRHVSESIHSIKPISQIFSDIITVYGLDYVISGPVWEYFNGPGWDTGLANEIAEDRLCGFTGKTVIHPKQIAIVNEAYKVEEKDFISAKKILNWDSSSHSLVAADSSKERMEEVKTHTNWAEKTLYLAKCYGVKSNSNHCHNEK